MTSRFMMSVAAVALIAGTGFASAQGMGGREGGAGGGAGGGAPAAAQQSAPSSGSGSMSSTPMNRDSATEPKGSEKGGMKSTQSDEKMAPGGAKNQRAQDDMKAGEKGKTAQDNNMSGDRSKGGMNSDKAEGRDSKAGNTNNAQTDSKSGNMNNAQTKSGADKSQTTGNAATSATAAPPAEKRTQIVSAIKSEKIEETTNVNFNISVGTRIPGNVRFHPLPSRIVEIYPEWRGYDVIFVHGRYIIVRPETHEIVYIIEG
jgi:hypothetical protein